MCLLPKEKEGYFEKDWVLKELIVFPYKWFIKRSAAIATVSVNSCSAPPFLSSLNRTPVQRQRTGETGPLYGAGQMVFSRSLTKISLSQLISITSSAKIQCSKGLFSNQRKERWRMFFFFQTWGICSDLVLEQSFITILTGGSPDLISSQPVPCQ